MRITHLAIPSNNINESASFYMRAGGKLGRHSSDWAIFDFYGMQLVCHLTQDKTTDLKMYPRHFGFVLDENEFNLLYEHFRNEDLPFFEPRFTRWRGTHAQHETFFLKDPASNLIEFKWYVNQDSIFGAE